ncbi:MAG TPA: MerR family transcriptional regulator [Acidimicrobiales bacterium]|nr:MerR family transcriptional regulator [Acidimicrobiales bacterium]
MTTVAPDPDPTPRLRIGEAAELAGMSTRTLRYYQELGLLTPSGTTAGGARRYSDVDVARLHRIRHLRDLVGFNLTEIGAVLSAEDRLAEIRREWWAEPSRDRARELLHEALAINIDLQTAVRAKMAGLEEFLHGLEERAATVRRRLEEEAGLLA